MKTLTQHDLITFNRLLTKASHGELFNLFNLVGKEIKLSFATINKGFDVRRPDGRLND